MKFIHRFPLALMLMIGIVSCFSCTQNSSEGPTGNTISFTTPQEAVPYMLRGINLGNTLEPEEEGGWNNGPAQEPYFDAYKAAGFTCVRVPVRWGSHTLVTPPYIIDPIYMTRVEQVVDWGLERNLFIILNAHHEDWLKQDYSEDNKARFDSIWSQIAFHFKDKSERLLFEMINEPFGMTREQVDDLNARILPIIRGDNPTRVVIYSGNEWSGLEQMMAAAIPDDPYLMAYWHAYDPWAFAGEGKGTWGTEADRQGIVSMFQEAADWSAANQIPVIISEFGAVHACDYNSRMRHYGSYVENAIKQNIPFQVWDDGGNFGVYQREAGTWPEVKDILIYGHPDSPTDLDLVSTSQTTVNLSWRIRGDAYEGISLQRRDGEADFVNIAELASDQTQYNDAGLLTDISYDYRLLAQMGGGLVHQSYPIRLTAEALDEERAPYHGSPISIPGIIEAEDFDRGGEGDAYHDTDLANIPNAYRPLEGVDIEARNTGGYQISYLESGEWLEYSISVPESRVYTIRTNLASMNGGGTFKFTASGAFSPVVTAPSTNSWQTLTGVSTTIPMVAGEQILRFSVVSLGDFNVDNFILE